MNKKWLVSMRAMVLLFSTAFSIASYGQLSVGVGGAFVDGFLIGRNDMELDATYGIQLSIGYFITDGLEISTGGVYVFYPASDISERLIGLSGAVSNPFFSSASLKANFFRDTDVALAPYASLGANGSFYRYIQSGFGTQQATSWSPLTGLGVRWFINQKIHAGFGFEYYWRKSNSWQGLLSISYNGW